MKDLFQELVLDPVTNCIKTIPSRNAFFIAGIYYTYRQFEEAIETERKRIHSLEDDIVSLDVKDDLKTYASIFACWYEGKAYVPLNPSWPQERKHNIIRQINQSNTNNSSNNTIKDPLAYILFTSGSTGVPKGVTISRRNVSAFMDSFWKTGITVDEEDRCLQCFDLTFDVSVQSFLVALTKGACVYTVPYGQVKYLNVASLIHEHHITFGAMAPSMLTYLHPYFGELDASAFKTCILTAEACPADLIVDWQRCAKNMTVYDFYGPTEATIYCSSYKCSRDATKLSTNGVVSIGKPLSNVTAVIVDENGNIINENDKKGELWVAGDQVTQGYWNNKEKNRESFSELEVDGETMRFYHTGDLCYWDESGNIMYVGRMDQQVKIQGFRVELSEIEHHARNYYDNKIQVAAIAIENSHNLTEIVLFVEKEIDNPDGLVAYLRNVMPSYMIPSQIKYVTPFPLNSNDKVDRVKLKKLFGYYR